MSKVRDEFVITECKHGNNKNYVIVNTRGEFECSHTHVANFDTAVNMVKLVSKQIPPKSKSINFVESLIRINKNKKYEIVLKLYMEELIKSKGN